MRMDLVILIVMEDLRVSVTKATISHNSLKLRFKKGKVLLRTATKLNKNRMIFKKSCRKYWLNNKL